ncbi:similar to Torulaspora delbrueckii TDEL_0H01740 hypothetical protein [Maudiozyma saulgeensis]|uniref:Uncharacterized protein n=1 Tax=Maudiozyma saulgeensis TaxID=1789683 RepID=A0A1X7QYN6_9SACH|nr:similar to Torulaspora delbrueckii TDEL_0H01740 hypothetical protein [Kazachstania saulgeensis]
MTEPISPQRELSYALSVHSINSNPSDNISTKAIYEGETIDLPLSRPMSRGSLTSNLSMNASKDGIEGNNPKRLGIPPYATTMLSAMTMSHNNKIRKFNNTSTNSNSSNNSSIIANNNIHKNITSPEDIFNDVTSVTSTPGYPDTPMSPPMTLREKMRLLNIERTIPILIDESADSLETSFTLHSNDMVTSQSMDNVLKYSGRQSQSHNHLLHPHSHKWTPFNNSNNNNNNGGNSNTPSTSLDTTLGSNVNLQSFHLRDNELHIPSPVITSELDSIASTLGDDTSYMRGFSKNSPQIISPTESYEEM